MFEVLSMNASTELTFIFSITLALLAGIVIGVERESRGKDAGISTQSLVVMGSMMFTFMSALVEPDSSARIAAQVVTGIGFLGAGLILKEGTTVHNLTTAASLWFSAAIGMAFGFGLYLIGIFATLVAVLTLRIPHTRTYNNVHQPCSSEHCSHSETHH